jgi:hypothetical protein
LETRKGGTERNIPPDNLAGISEDPYCPLISSEVHWLLHDSSYACGSNNENNF